MTVLASIRSQLAPVHREGLPFIGIFALASLFLFWLWSPLGWLGTMATLWCIYFFRDPVRVTPIREGIVVAPADGRVSRITNAVPPQELELGERSLPRVSIFMSVFDCHVNRSPMAGKIERIVYHHGAFLSADLDKASESNERNSMVIAAGKAPHRGGADRRPGGAPDRVLRGEGHKHRRRRAHWHDPLRLARRRIPAGRRAPAGRGGTERYRRRDHYCRPACGRSAADLPGGLNR